ncbi:MAG TPA: hypothetical protein VGO34_14870 [Alphaproteobacteria bacterium]|jgi:hypothetical protein
MKNLIAVKPMVYATRRLVAGQRFEAKDRDAVILIGGKKAKEDREIGELPPPSSALLDKAKANAPAGDIAAMRVEYKNVAGKNAFNGWDAATLRDKLAEARKA